MKKIVSLILALGLLASQLILPVSAASAPKATDWYAVQETYNPTHTRAQFKDGRVVVNSIVNGSEPGAATVIYTQPIDLDNFQVSFSLDNYVKCADQSLNIGFINGGEDELHLGTVSVPDFMALLRPTDLPTVISTAEGLLKNYDVDRDMLRPGKSSFVPGHYFEGEVEASWTNVVFKVTRNAANTGYDVFVNNKQINNQNTWSFVDMIEKKTGCDKWYFYITFKDGNYSPVQFTIKTINGQSAVDPSVSGMMQNSLLEAGESYAAVGGLLGDKVVDGDNVASTTKKPDATKTTTKPTTKKPTTTKPTTTKPTTSKTTVNNPGTTAPTTAAPTQGIVTDTPTAPIVTDPTQSVIPGDTTADIGVSTDAPIPGDTTLPSDPAVTDPVGSDPSVSDPAVTEPTGEDTQPTDPTTQPSGSDVQSGADDEGGSLWWLWVIIAVVVIGGGVCVYLFVIRKKQA